jgi:two-component system CitB family response regulator
MTRPIDVLVVDDDTRVARVNAAYVAKVPGFRMAGEAHNAADALHRMETLPHPDLVLMDHYLPDGTGLAVIQEMRRRGHQIDVIMVTAARDVRTVQAALRHSALQYLVNLPGLKAGASVFGASGDVGECPASTLAGGGVV